MSHQSPLWGGTPGKRPNNIVDLSAGKHTAEIEKNCHRFTVSLLKFCLNVIQVTLLLCCPTQHFHNCFSCQTLLNWGKLAKRKKYLVPFKLVGLEYLKINKLNYEEKASCYFLEQNLFECLISHSIWSMYFTPNRTI